MNRAIVGAALVALALGIGISTVLARGSRDTVTCKLVNGHKVKCPERKLRGPRGKQGEQGPAGPVGPALGGSDGITQSLNYVAPSGSATETVATLEGAKIEASCSAGGELSATITMTANDNAVQVTNLGDGSHDGDGDADQGESFDLDLHGSADDASHQLNYMSAGGEVSTATYGIEDGAGSLGAAGDCALFGLVRTPTG